MSIRWHDRLIGRTPIRESQEWFQIFVDREKYGIRLMPELYEHLNPMPFEAAAQMEKDLPKIYVRRATPSQGERDKPLHV